MTAILLHLYYQDLWNEFKTKIVPILNDNVHLYISVNSYSEYIEDMKKYAKEIFFVKNKGTDFGPFVYTYNKIKNDGYKYILKLHGKKSLISVKKGYGDFWRSNLVNSIISTPEKFNKILSVMDNNPQIFMAGSLNHLETKLTEYENHGNRLNALNAIERLCRYVKSNNHGSFISGSMFLTTTYYLNLFFGNCDLDELYEQFEEFYSNDGTLLSHGLERVIGYGVETHNGKFLLLERD